MTQSVQAPSRAATMLKRFFVGTVVLALTSAVVVLLSERNSRTYGVELQGTELVIMKGRLLPYGLRPYAPPDRALAQAYAPVPAWGEVPADLAGPRFDDRDELDRALFRTLRSWIEPRLDADSSERLEQGVKLLRRAELLAGISDEQRAQLRDLQGRAAFFEGHARLEEAAAAMREAVEKLKLASEGRSRYARDAAELYDRVHPLSETLSHDVRLPLGLPPRLLQPTPEAAPAAPKAVAPQPAPAAPPVEAVPAAPEAPAAPN